MRAVFFGILLLIFGSCTPPSTPNHRALLDSLNQEKMYVGRPDYTLHVLDSLALDSHAIYHLLRGKCLLKMHQFLEAEQALQQAEQMSGSDSLTWADAHLLLSHGYVFQEYYQLGLKHAAKALSFSALPKSKRIQSNGILGLIAQGLKNDSLAIRYFHRVIIGSDSIKTRYVSSAYHNLGHIYCSSSQVRNLDSALFYTQKAIEIKQYLGDRYGVLGAETNLAEVYLRQGHPQQALALLQEVLQKEDDLGDSLTRMPTYQMLAETHLVLRQFSEARRYAQLCAETSLKKRSRELHLTALKTEALIAIEEQNYYEAEQALYAFDLARKEHIAETQANLQEDIEREKENVLEQQKNHSLQMQVQKAHIQRRLLQWQMAALILGIIILSYLMYGMYQRYRARIKAQQAVQEALRGEINIAKEKEQEALQKLTQTGKEQIRLREMMKEIQEGFAKIKETDQVGVAPNLDRIVQQANKMLHDQDLFLEHMEQTQAEFFATLHLKFPNLTEAELRICGLLALELSSKEIAVLLNVEPRSVDTFRYRIRKKLHLSAEDNLADILKTQSTSGI